LDDLSSAHGTCLAEMQLHSLPAPLPGVIRCRGSVHDARLQVRCADVYLDGRLQFLIRHFPAGPSIFHTLNPFAPRSGLPLLDGSTMTLLMQPSQCDLNSCSAEAVDRCGVVQLYCFSGYVLRWGRCLYCIESISQAARCSSGRRQLFVGQAPRPPSVDTPQRDTCRRLTATAAHYAADGTYVSSAFFADLGGRGVVDAVLQVSFLNLKTKPQMRFQTHL
jgi:hypothetical protein